MNIVLLLIGSYAIGNFLPALLFGRSTDKSIRTEGSGNPGARNAGRVFGKWAFLLVLGIDGLKGAIAVLTAGWLGYGSAVQLAALAAVMLGHCYPVIYKFQGGKGAAAFTGGLLAFNAYLIFPIVFMFCILHFVMRRFTASSVLAVFGIIPFCLVKYDTSTTIFAFFIWVLLLVSHQNDIQLFRGRMQTE